MKSALITNFCPFYRIKLFKILAKKINAKFFFFSDASEKNWETQNIVNSDGLPVVPLLTPGMSKIQLLIKLWKELRNDDYDVYIQGISGRLIVPLTYIAARLRRKRYIVWTGFWNHPDTFFHRLTFPIVKYIYRHSDGVVAYGTHVRDYLITLGVDKKKIFIAQNTADNELYNKKVSEIEKNCLIKSLDIENKKIILFVGRLSTEKGVDVLLQSVLDLKSNNIPRPAGTPFKGGTNHKLNQIPLAPFKKGGISFKFIIIGRGPEKGNLQKFCEKNNLDNVIFLDYVPNDQLYKYYNIADIVAVPSITTPVFKEPWGLIVNEAMNQSAVVIASDAVGAAMGGLIEDGKNGIIIPEKKSVALSDAIKKVLSDHEYQNKLSSNAKEKIQKWTYDKMAQGFIDAVGKVA